MLMASAGRSRAATVARQRYALAAAGVSLSSLALTSFEQGGYFASAWGWTAFGLLLATAMALAFRDRIAVTHLEGAFVAGLTVVLLWTVMSSLWSASVPRTVAEVERTIIYLAAITAVFAVVSAERLPTFLGGVLVAIVAVSASALAHRVAARATGHPLSGPVGYWNALGILASIGILVAIGFLTARLPRGIRLGAAAAVPVLATTLYLTRSRGAVGALVAGLFVFAFLHPAMSARRQRAAAAAVLGLAVVVLAVVAVRAGGPGELLGKTSAAFRAPATPGAKPGEKLFTLSGTSRSDYWRVAWDEYRAHPWLGSGAGTFDLYWNLHRNTIYGARDAHNLYLETLAELGPVGLLALIGTLALPFAGLRGRRRDPLLAAATGGYVAFLVHAGVDWDWEMPAVTLAGLFCGGSLIVAASGGGRPISSSTRWMVLAVAAVLAAFTAVAYRGNAAEIASVNAADAGNYVRAQRTAHTATRWTPWSSDAWRLLGEAQIGLGDRRRARASFQTGIAKDPREWRLWFDLARVSTGTARERALAEAARLNRYSLVVRAAQGD